MINPKSLNALDKELYFLYRDLPKSDNHIHLSGSVNPGVIKDIIMGYPREERSQLKESIRDFMYHELLNLEHAKVDGRDHTKKPEELAEGYLRENFDPLDFNNIQTRQLRKLMIAGDDCHNLHDYLLKFPFVQSFMQSSSNLEQIANQFILDQKKDGVIYVEPRISPTNYTKGGLTTEEVFAACTRGFKEGAAETGVEWRIILTAMRHNADDVKETMEAALNLKNKFPIVGVDLAGPEYGHPVEHYHDDFCDVFGKGLGITVHAGEAYGPQSIKQAITHGNAERIGHAATLINNSGLLDAIVDRRIGLEIMLSSIYQTKGLAIEKHPLKEYEQRGARWFLCTDNPTVSNTTLTKEYFTAAKAYGWSNDTIVRGILNGFKSAMLPYRETQQLVKKAISGIEERGIVVPKYDTLTN